MRYVYFLTICAVFLLGCVTTQNDTASEKRTIDAVQAGDQRLGCDELRSEMAQMDAYIREGERVEAERQKGQASETATSTAAGSVPFGGLIHRMTVSQPRNAEWINARERGGQAAKRKEHLATLFNQKNCPLGQAPARS